MNINCFLTIEHFYRRYLEEDLKICLFCPNYPCSAVLRERTGCCFILHTRTKSVWTLILLHKRHNRLLKIQRFVNGRNKTFALRLVIPGWKFKLYISQPGSICKKCWRKMRRKKKTFVVEESSVTFTTRWGVALQNGQQWAFIAGILWK